MKTPERNKLQREFTILQAKKRSGIGFSASDAERIADLEDQLGIGLPRLPPPEEHTNDEPPVLELGDEADLSEADLVDPSTVFDTVQDTKPDLPLLSSDDATLPNQHQAEGVFDNDAYSLDTLDPASAKQEGQELLQGLFDATATGSLDANGILTKVTPPPLPKTTSSAKKPLAAPRPSRVALGKLRVVSKAANDAARRELEPPPDSQFKGPRKAIVHFLDGVCRRGSIKQPDVSADIIQLDPQPNESAPVEELPTEKLKTIFLLLPRGSPYPQKVGKPITVLLVDGRTLSGTSQDYDADCNAFTLLPTEDKGNVERVIIFRRGTKQIECNE